MPYHPDGQRRETDTTHTVMLTWVACALAERIEGLNIGVVAVLAAVHDLPEVHAGDVPTLRTLSSGDKEAKAAREALAIDLLELEYEDLPWFPRILRVYEKQELREARFVKAVDKLLPKAVVLQEASLRSIRESGMTAAEHDYHMGPDGPQAEDLASYAAEWPLVLETRNVLVRRLTEAMKAAGL